MKKRGFIVVFSAPSGTGKTSILKEVLSRNKEAVYSISVTTRSKRPEELDGKDYHFVSKEEFKKKIERGEFAEWAEVHGSLYGTLRENLTQASEQGKIVIVDADTQGAMQIKKRFPDSVTIFIAPPSIESLEQRLRRRGTDSQEAIERRLADAPGELGKIPEYDYLIVNEDIDRSVGEVLAILEAESCRTKRCRYP
ncbi:MAG TPA: guanylate kinase [Candidatus Latescibacteria bacterium]|nr:guanylate kinase [Candidatus Latescibacterota bacterium]